jgi:chromosome segregation ATPase
MSRIGITYPAVEAAALHLQGLGKNPTVDRIREILGTGSKTTIARHLRTWHEQLPQSDSKNVPAELMSMVSGLWIQLQEKASQRVTELEQVYEEKIALLLAQQAQNESEIKMLQSTVNQLELMLSEETKINQKLQDELLVKEAETNRIIHRSSGLENSLNDQKSENEKLYLLFNNVQRNMEHYQMAMQQLQQEQSIAMDAQKEQYEKALKELQQRLSIESIDKSKLIIQLEQSVSEFKKHQNRISELETNLKEKEFG